MSSAARSIRWNATQTANAVAVTGMTPRYSLGRFTNYIHSANKTTKLRAIFIHHSLYNHIELCIGVYAFTLFFIPH